MKGTFFTLIIIKSLNIISIDCASFHHPKSTNHVNNNRQSKASNIYTEEDQNQSSIQPTDWLKRTELFEINSERKANNNNNNNNNNVNNNDRTNSNVFFNEPTTIVHKHTNNGVPLSLGTTFENVPANYIGPNYMINNIAERNLQDDSITSSAAVAFVDSSNENQQQQQQHQQQTNPSFYQSFLGNSLFQSNTKPQKEDTINDVFVNAFKKYNVKKYLMQKIFGRY